MGKAMKRANLLIVVLTVLALVAGGASAADAAKKKTKTTRGLYAGFGVGLSEFEPLDNEAFSWRMMAWLRACKYGSIEFGYVNPGDPSGGEDVDGVHAALVPMLPIGDSLTLLAKIGVLIGTNDDSTDEELSYGFGLTFDLPDPFPKTLGLRAEWERFDESAIDTFTVGPYYRFVEFRGRR